MRILQVGKFHFPQGGADKYFLDLSSSLERRGHSVARFSMRHPKNVPSVWEPYFSSQVHLTGTLWEKIKALGRPYYSFEERRLFEKLVKDFRPEIIHVHNICYYLSPSFLLVARKYHIPVVMHLHDYSLLSPNYLLFSEDGNYEGGKAGRYFECVKDRCFKRSYILSLLTALQMYFHHRILKIFAKNITWYIAPSECVKKVVESWRPDIKNIKVIMHGTLVTPLDEVVRYEGKPYFLYLGRLSLEKGIDVLIDAFAKMNDTEVVLKIIGSGPEKERLEKKVFSLGIQKQVEFLGFKKGNELKIFVEQSVAVVIPSQWREVFGLVAIEAMERGKVVIASRSGALPEIIEDGKTGILFDSRDKEELVQKMRWVLGNEMLSRKIGMCARQTVTERYSLEKHLDQVEKLYQEIIQLKNK